MSGSLASATSGKTLRSKPDKGRISGSKDAKLEEAIGELRMALAGQLRTVQVIADAAVLAAEQVQDKRLEILECGPEASVADVLIDFGITVLLESTIVGKLVGKLATHVLNRRLRAQAAALRGVIDQRMLTSVEINALVAMGPSTKLVKSAKRALSMNNNEIRSLSDQLKQLNATARLVSPLTAGLSGEITAVVKGVRQAAPTAQRLSPEFAPSDTPGVTVVDVAQTFLASQRYSLELEAIALEFFVRSGSMDPKQLLSHLALEDGTGIQAGADFDREDALGLLKERAKRSFECIIWTLLLAERPLNGAAPPTTPGQIFLNIRRYVQPSLITYWLKRFIDPETDRPFGKTPGLLNPATGRIIDRAVGILQNHMKTIWQNAQREGVSLVVEGELRARRQFLAPKPSEE